MASSLVINFFSKFITKFEPNFTLRLEAIEYSPRLNQEICVLQLVGKNAFPKFTPEEILNNEKLIIGLRSQDAIQITKLHQEIIERKKRCCVLDVDRNGTILMRDGDGNIKRYSEKVISSSREMLKHMKTEDAHDLGYRVGFREGLGIKTQMKSSRMTIKQKFNKLVNEHLKSS